MSDSSQDIVSGLREWRLWSTMGWNDIVGKYRRTVIGPFWLTLSMTIFIGALGLLYGKLFRADLGLYIPYLTMGFIVWGLISTLILESCGAFTEAQGIIKQIKMPLSIFIYRIVWRSIIVFFHNLPVVIPVAIIFRVWPSAYLPMFLIGLALIAVTGVWVGLVLGILCTRYRDLPPLVTSLTQIAFFVTPIIWNVDLLGKYEFLVNFNPFYHYLELVRGPILGYMPTALNWSVSIFLSVAGFMGTLLLFRRYRNRIVYWL